MINKALFKTSKVKRFISNMLWFVRVGEYKTRLWRHLWEMRLLHEPYTTCKIWVIYFVKKKRWYWFFSLYSYDRYLVHKTNSCSSSIHQCWLFLITHLPWKRMAEHTKFNFQLWNIQMLTVQASLCHTGFVLMIKDKQGNGGYWLVFYKNLECQWPLVSSGFLQPFWSCF